MNMNPPAIYHQDRRPRGYQSMIRDMATNIHLRQQAATLLTYYANQSDGFRPAKKTVNLKTGIPVDDVDRVRRQLVNHGLIYFLPYKCVIIQWERIAAYAMLDKPIHSVKVKYFCAAKLDTPRVRDLPDFNAYKPRQCRLDEEQKSMLRSVENMTIDEYSEWLTFGIDRDYCHDGAA